MDKVKVNFAHISYPCCSLTYIRNTHLEILGHPNSFDSDFHRKHLITFDYCWFRRRDWDEQNLVSIVLDEVDNWLKEIVLKSLIQNKQKSPISGQVRFK